MKKYINPHSIANTLRMTRSQHSGTFLVVEGDSDLRVYKRFVKENLCHPISAHNKDDAISALEILEKDNFAGVLAVVDADYWHLDDYEPESPNLVTTDTHDLETMILSTEEVVEKMLSEFGSRNKIKQLKNSERAISPIEMVLETALPIGLLRWLSTGKDNLRIKFTTLLTFENLEHFIDPVRLIININKLLNEAKKHTDNDNIDFKAIKKKINCEIEQAHDPWQVCSGHDVVQLLTIGFRSVFGNRKSKSLTPEVVEGMLRMAYEYSCFRRTRLYESIKNWEKGNPGFIVLQ